MGVEVQGVHEGGGGGGEAEEGSEVDSGVVFMRCCYHAEGKLAPPVLCPSNVVGW